MNIDLNTRLAEALLMDKLLCARGTEPRDVHTAPATFIRYGCAWCSEECAERASDYDRDSGQLFKVDRPCLKVPGIFPDLSGDGRGTVMLLNALTHRGLCPILLFDDDGRWALSFNSMTAPVGVVVPMDAGDDDVFALIWDESIPMAVALAADAYLKENTS